LVKIHFCPKCKKASREHLFKKVFCKVCNTSYDVINIPRSRYFIVQFIFLFLAITILLGSFIVYYPYDKIFEFMGISILGISMLVFTLYFQMLDSREMELRAERRVMDEEYGDVDHIPFGTTTLSTKSRLESEKGDEEAEEAKGLSALFRKEESAQSEPTPPPRVTRIRRALPRDGAPAGSAESELSKPKRSEPIVIRDISSILADEDEEEGEEEEEVRPKKMKKVKKVR
jgi:hypothetical protein